MITNYPLGHLKISGGDLPLLLSHVNNCIQNRKKSYCLPLHMTKYELSKADQKLKNVIRSADIVLADGAPIQWFCRRLGYKTVHHITGIEFAEAILERSRVYGWSLYFLGARPQNLEKALTNIKFQYSHPRIVGSHDGYFASGELSAVIEEINSLRPDILFLGLGMPQKEYFISDYLDKIDASFLLPVGGAFDIWARVKRRSPVVLQRIGLEWLQRSLYDRNKARNVFTYGFSFFKDFLFYRP
jgi:N-acetylglucosaminyldiphosphoundecaprenol N-acetyl-beta-D-mannosaminyltransferase